VAYEPGPRIEGIVDSRGSSWPAAGSCGRSPRRPCDQAWSAQRHLCDSGPKRSKVAAPTTSKWNRRGPMIPGFVKGSSDGPWARNVRSAARFHDAA